MGALAAILGVSAPAKAAAGSQVYLTVSVQNAGDEEGFIYCLGLYNGSAMTSVDEQYRWLAIDARPDFALGFAMPPGDAECLIAVGHWDGEKWVPDDTRELSIAEGAPSYGFAIGRPVVASA